MSALGDRLNQGAEWYNARPKRERLLILVTGLLLVLFVGWELAVAPALAQNDQLRSREAELQRTYQQWQQQEIILAEKVQENPEKAMRERLTRRQQRLGELDRELAEITDRLVSPEAMVSLLRRILANQQGLSLVGMDLMDPVPIYSQSESEEEETGAREPLLYAHDVELRVSGRYLELLAYLERLEALDQRLGWSELLYEVSEFPEAEARVRVRTLSLSQAGLGV
jgi:MSHA biogenesis protein MshJ